MVQTLHVFDKNLNLPMNMSKRVWVEEGSPLSPEKECKLHAFLVTNGFLYVPSGFFVFTIPAGILLHTKGKNISPSMSVTNTLVAEPRCVIRVLPEGYKPCLKISRRYEQMKALQRSQHITVADIVFDQWKLKGRREVLDYTIDMVDGGVYDPEGTMVKEFASLFMAENFVVKT
jgi:hypothetical protein